VYHLRFFWLAICTNFKLSMSLRAAFLITILATIVKQVLFLVMWSFFFERYKVVQGWTFEHMLVMYGLVCFAMGIAGLFFYGIKELSPLIESSQLDTFLLQPKNIILNIAMSKGDISDVGEVITGILLMGYSGYLIKAFPIILILCVVIVVFMFSLYLYLSCIAFFVRNSYDLIRELNLNAIIVATQPVAAYRGVFKMFTFTLLPVAFLSFLPVEYFRTGLWYYLWATILGTAVFFGIACWLFKLGLKRYESGNMIVYRH